MEKTLVKEATFATDHTGGLSLLLDMCKIWREWSQPASLYFIYLRYRLVVTALSGDKLLLKGDGKKRKKTQFKQNRDTDTNRNSRKVAQSMNKSQR